MEAFLNLYFNTLFDSCEHTCFAWNNSDTSILTVSAWQNQRSPWLCLNPISNDVDIYCCAVAWFNLCQANKYSAENVAYSAIFTITIRTMDWTRIKFGDEASFSSKGMCCS